MGGRGVIFGLVAVVSITLAGCSSPPGHRGVATDGVARRITVYYATDRAATSREDPEAVEYGWKRAYLEGDRPYELGVCKVEIARERSHDKIAPLPHMGSELVRLISTSTLERSEFYGRLREKMWNAGANETFVFVHGFNNDFESAAQRTAELWYDVGFEGPPIMFSWASRGGRFWRGLFGYLADEETIEWSAMHLKKFLQELAAETSAQKLLGYEPARIHLIAHSMGCRALTRALALIADELRQGDRPIFADVILAAPDIDRDVLRDVIVPELFEAPVAEHFTLYASSADLVIKTSGALQVYPRAGDAQEGIVVVDADEFDTIDASHMQSGFELHHDYFVTQPRVLRDLIEILVKRNRDPSSPGRGMRRRHGEPDQPWELLPESIDLDHRAAVAGSE
ncbi:MAG: alpha/beta hydrolase [Planctomycetota bacterium]|jgi:esterase/lipase superfamily enzyme